MSWLLAALGVVVAVGLWLWARARVRRLRPIPEAVPARSVGELDGGRYRVTGTVVPIDCTPSRIDDAPCVFLEHAEYRTVGSELVPLLREIEHGTVAHPFYLEDATGRLLVNPREAVIEAVTVFEHAGLSAERRLRAGEEVELVATFEPSPVEADGGPYRASHNAWRPVPDTCGPPRISYRTAPDMVHAADDVTMFLRGAGVFALLATALFSALTLL